MWEKEEESAQDCDDLLWYECRKGTNPEEVEIPALTIIKQESIHPKTPIKIVVSKQEEHRESGS